MKVGDTKIKPWVPKSWGKPYIDRSTSTYFFCKGGGRCKAYAHTHANLAYYNGFDPNNFPYYVEELKLKPDEAKLWK